jgi:hypothetical protein
VFVGIQDDGKSPEKFCEFCPFMFSATIEAICVGATVNLPSFN